MLRPEGGSYTLRSFEQLLVLAEECQLNFAFETQYSGEDAYVDKLVENERKVDWDALTDKQKSAYFKLLIRGTGAKDSSYTGFRAGKRSRSYEEDVARVDTMRNQAMLNIGQFTSTRNRHNEKSGYAEHRPIYINSKIFGLVGELLGHHVSHHCACERLPRGPRAEVARRQTRPTT
jgi:hypothetical protein